MAVLVCEIILAERYGFAAIALAYPIATFAYHMRKSLYFKAVVSFAGNIYKHKYLLRAAYSTFKLCNRSKRLFICHIRAIRSDKRRSNGRAHCVT